MISISPLTLFGLLPSLVVIFYQLLYLIFSFRITIRQDAPTLGQDLPSEDLSILIPVFGDGDTIRGTLQSIHDNACPSLTTVVVVLDRCNDQTQYLVRSFIQHFAIQGVSLVVEKLPDEVFGKVQALLYGGRFISTRTVLLLDSDIILEKNAIRSLLHFHVKEGAPYSSCLIYPFDGGDDPHPLSQQIVCNNRLYRQSVLQTVKNLYHCSNFPGGVQMVDFEVYKKLLVDGFLEDLTATYAVLGSGGRIAILPTVLAYEIERTNILGQYLQRVRWTIGAIQHIPVQISTARKRKRAIEKILVNSYHIMWEVQYYIIFTNLVLLAFLPALAGILLLPILLYVCNIFRSVQLTWSNYRNTIAAALLHCLIHPFLISFALPSSIVYVLFKRGYNFQSKALFRRT